jgi:hypothetical protein
MGPPSLCFAAWPRLGNPLLLLVATNGGLGRSLPKSSWHNLKEQLRVENNDRLEVVGALEEGSILMIERAIFEGGQGANAPRNATLSQLYNTYSQTLSNLMSQECLNFAMDPHTLLIGAGMPIGRSLRRKYADWQAR